ncbi:MAG: RDD family protein [Acidimicrobiia bacterium]
MSGQMDDYYELLGVDVDAPVGDIRTAYRDKKAAVANQGTEQAKSDAAALNKAWNVLSDPYQRGRYDEQRGNADDATDSDDEDDDADDAAPVPARRRPAKTKSRTSPRETRAAAKPTIALPAGMAFSTVRARRIAMFIDLGLLFVLFLASQFLMVALEKSEHPSVYKDVSTVDKLITTAQSKTNAANKAKSGPDKNYTDLVKTKGANAPDTQAALAAKKPLDAAATAAKNAQNALNTRLNKDESDLAPTSNLVSGGFFLVSLLVLLLPSLFGGATIGKREQKIRVVRLDGSPARVGDLFRRYAVLVFAAYVLTSFLRSPVGAVIVVFIAAMTRNPNTQALHDRFAKTLVVTDSEE